MCPPRHRSHQTAKRIRQPQQTRAISLHRLFQCVAVTNFVSAIAYSVIYARGGWLAARARIATPQTETA